jgi:hypothetical protein
VVVTRQVYACGKMNLVRGNLRESKRATEAQPFPESPRPCRKIQVEF